jgi:hypothetical protein
LHLFYYLVPPTTDNPDAFIAQLLDEADLSELVQLDIVNQIQYFLEERAHLMNQVCPKLNFFYLILQNNLDGNFPYTI